ncbi:aldo/keto reductase [Candidatus Nitrosotenuis aquarius]|uniref:aldo/keto reductase n=1 Tax=Candidatus Nitrosotenuis aquarius TaxID=1846278 RepID=UPI000C1E97C4|nr:aldo/keto reductase [Candidatus Nitrosotenuis aquarius]
MIETATLGSDLKICRIINGMWQVSGGHGHITPQKAISEMDLYHKAGLTSWDMADIYGPAEGFFGKFRQNLEKSGHDLSGLVGLTKFVPNPVPMNRTIVERAIKNSILHMNVSSLDLVQFHWWDYDDPRYFDALYHLTALRDEGKIKHIGLTNFDTIRMQMMLDKGFVIVSNQVQYSIIDQRPQMEMEEFCKKHNIHLLAYGTLGGGLLSERFLGSDDPTRIDLNTYSLQKYHNMIDAWGGWTLFQKLLHTLDKIAKKHHTSIPNVATRFILDKPQVAGVIIGARLGIAQHIEQNKQTFSLNLDSDDYSAIQEITSQANDLFDVIGDCGSEYR